MEEAPDNFKKLQKIIFSIIEGKIRSEADISSDKLGMLSNLCLHESILFEFIGEGSISNVFSFGTDFVVKFSDKIINVPKSNYIAQPIIQYKLEDGLSGIEVYERLYGSNKIGKADCELLSDILSLEGITWRDPSPRNVGINTDGILKVLDTEDCFRVCSLEEARKLNEESKSNESLRIFKGSRRYEYSELQKRLCRPELAEEISKRNVNEENPILSYRIALSKLNTNNIFNRLLRRFNGFLRTGHSYDEMSKL